jgi:tetratricopeptide (TPR) repeat protein
MIWKILFALILAQGQANPTGAIRGQIIIPSVSAFDRIQVVVQRSDGPIVARIFSDTLGHFEVRNLANGNYDILVDVDGYEPVRQQVGVSSGGYFNAASVNITLREKEKTAVVKPDGSHAEDTVDITELSRKYPKKAIQDYEKAKAELRNKNEAKALELLLSAIKVAPDFYDAHNTLGSIYQKQSQFQEAEAEFTRARELNPRAPEPLVNLGSLYIDEAAASAAQGPASVGKILDKALDILEASLKMKRSPMAYYFLGTAYYRSSFYDEAETNFKHALEMDSRFPAGRLMLANTYIKQRMWQNALEHLDIYLADNPKASDREQIQETRERVAQRIK